MVVSSYYLAIIIGLTLSLLIEIKLGISPGGLVVPSYIALVLDNPMVVLNIFLVSILTYLIIKYIVAHFLLIYGKRRFIACVMVALLLKFLLSLLYPHIPFEVFSFSGIGVVASGILANCYFRQGVVLTTVATLLTSAVTFLLINFAYFI